MVTVYCWFSLNSLLMQLIEVDGQICVIFFVMPGIVYLVKCLRDVRIQQLLVYTSDKQKLDIDSLNQIITI